MVILLKIFLLNQKHPVLTPAQKNWDQKKYVCFLKENAQHPSTIKTRKE